MKMIISQAHDSTLLRDYLKHELTVSSRLLARLKQAPDGILLNGSAVTVRALLHTGDILEIRTEDANRAAPQNIVPRALPLSVLYEDSELLVCNKPGNMPTHPSHGHYDDTLANAVAFYDCQTHASPHVFRPVNRLDRETSGTVLIARNQLAAQRLSHAMQTREIRKSYLAILQGMPPEPEGEILTGIRRRQQSVIFREVCAPDAADAALAITHYRVLADWQSPDGCGEHAERLCLVSACPQTGRTHQLRVHFAHIGTPILGDMLYGNGSTALISRQALHALSLTFPHPTSGRICHIRAPLPPDMRALLPLDVWDNLNI